MSYVRENACTITVITALGAYATALSTINRPSFLTKRAAKLLSTETFITLDLLTLGPLHKARSAALHTRDHGFTIALRAHFLFASIAPVTCRFGVTITGLARFVKCVAFV